MLDAIIAHKREVVAGRKRLVPEAALRRSLVPGRHALRERLGGTRPLFIFECKRASPSAGLLRPEADLEAIAGIYNEWADAVSVLTEARFFKGSLGDLAFWRTRTTLPLLRKDILVDPYEVLEARHLGADAVLLMLSVLDDPAYTDCLALARELGLDALTEVHDERELERALNLGCDLLGINNRNLRTLEIDRDTTRRLAPLVPEGLPVIAESGIETHAHIRDLGPSVDGFLVGSALMRSPRIDLAARGLRLGQIKVCGLTRIEDARLAWELGATHGGLNFVAGSPRAVTPGQAQALVQAVPLAWVGVFQDAEPQAMADRAHTLGLSALQLHGNEPRAVLDRLREKLPAHVAVWKAVPWDAPPVRAETVGADRLVLDSACGSRMGGTGIPFDPARARLWPDLSQAVIAGGIGPDVIETARRLDPWLIDVNSAVEESPGRKDRERLTRLFDQLRLLPHRNRNLS